MTYEVLIDGKSYRLQLDRPDGRWQCRLDGREVQLDAVLTRPDVLSVLIGGKAYEIKRERAATDLHLWVGSARYAAELRDPRSLRNRKGGAGGEKGPRKLVAPMPGKVVRLLVAENAPVEAGQGVLVVEAMKMQNEIKSPKKGTVQKLATAEGANVNAGDVLAIVE
ncbi:MAG TPA: biotin/lipoyl-containing protein [Terriglobales bacterium]|jgi:biotin carboxyl carrier protein|nr:biotin/lipoyl-containing protein [Terriglobales bacterium]